MTDRNAPHIVVIGAGSAIFGTGTLATLIREPRLRGATLGLCDLNAATLETMHALAERMNRAWDAGMTIAASTDRRALLRGADFVIVCIQVGPREVVWRQDWEIPLRHGVRQPYAENGGPGGFAHAARNIGPVLEIVHAMEQACPDAWFINYTNPMIRICDAIARHSSIKVVGLCHQIHAGYGMVGYVLADDLDITVPAGVISAHADPDIWPRLNLVADQAMEKVDIKAAGLNHFTWMLDIRHKETGEDLYPLFAERWAAFDPSFEPLTRRVYAAFGRFPIPGDEGGSPDPGGGDQPGALAGLSEADATAAAAQKGFTVRIIARDGEWYPVTKDYRLDRINFVVVNGVVVDATIG